MRILGVDPGLSITGYGVIETAGGKIRLIEAGTLKSRPIEPLEKRLLELFKGIREILLKTRPDSMAVETLFSHYKHPSAALQMAHARGVLLLAAVETGIPVFAYEPARVKKSVVGLGRATKSQVQQMVQSVFALKSIPEPPDIADAVAVALCHANALCHGQETRRSKRGELPEILKERLTLRGKRPVGEDLLSDILSLTGRTK